MPPPTSIDKYQVIASLGSGHFGEVFHVFDRALSAEKAIKVLANTNSAAFMKNLEEAQILNRCRHKHIVTINEANIFLVNGQHRVVLDLEFVPEGSLESALSTRWISTKETITYIRGALHGLEHAHGQGFLHRDVKPGNILLARANPKLSDFGLATDSGATLLGSAKGYRPHLPPEYYVRPGTSVQTDIFAVGMTMFRSLANISDWRAIINSTPNFAQHFQQGTLISKLGFEAYIPDSIRRIVRKSCNPDPVKRYSSAAEVGQHLDALRFGIDWVKDADNEWHGFDSGKQYRCVVDIASCKLTTYINGRRNSSLCHKYTSASDAIKAMHLHVANTTLR